MIWPSRSKSGRLHAAGLRDPVFADGWTGSTPPLWVPCWWGEAAAVIRRIRPIPDAGGRSSSAADTAPRESRPGGFCFPPPDGASLIRTRCHAHDLALAVHRVARLPASESTGGARIEPGAEVIERDGAQGGDELADSRGEECDVGVGDQNAPAPTRK